jgi:hypothetical protein
MDELLLPLSGRILDRPLNQSVDEFLSTPAIWLPGMDADAWSQELDLTFDRALATHAFLDGQLSPDQFEDALNHFGILDPRELADAWEEGKTFY